MSRRVISAQFTDPREFAGEALRDKDLIERGIVRVTKETRPGAIGVRHLAVIATYVCEGRVVTLRAFCGYLWDMKVQDDYDTRRLAQRTVDELERALTAVGIEVRPGVWTDEQ